MTVQQPAKPYYVDQPGRGRPRGGHPRAPRHGAVSTPKSRAMIYLAEWQANGLESGKFFPATSGGISDPFAPTDDLNVAPPPDGQIASAGKSFASSLDEPGDRWEKHLVVAGEPLTLSWTYHVGHKTRRWNYFITDPNWDPDQKLTRAQFGAEPFETVLYTGQPHWEHDLMPPDPTVHTVKIPRTHAGYHVLLAVWEVANTGNAFYQVIDLDIIQV